MDNKLNLDVQQLSILINNLDDERLKDAEYWLSLDLDAADISIEEKGEIFKLCHLIQETIDYREIERQREAYRNKEQAEAFAMLEDGPLPGQQLSRITYYGDTILGEIGEEMSPTFGNMVDCYNPKEGSFHWHHDFGDLLYLRGSWYIWSQIMRLDSAHSK